MKKNSQNNKSLPNLKAKSRPLLFNAKVESRLMQKNERKLINVYANGDPFNRACLVLLTHMELKDVALVCQASAEKGVQLPNNSAIRRICTLEGKQIESPSELEDSQFYVACGKEPFMDCSYGFRVPNLNLGTKLDRKSYDELRFVTSSGQSPFKDLRYPTPLVPQTYTEYTADGKIVGKSRSASCKPSSRKRSEFDKAEPSSSTTKTSAGKVNTLRQTKEKSKMGKPAAKDLPGSSTPKAVGRRPVSRAEGLGGSVESAENSKPQQNDKNASFLTETKAVTEDSLQQTKSAVDNVLTGAYNNAQALVAETDNQNNGTHQSAHQDTHQDTHQDAHKNHDNHSSKDVHQSTHQDTHQDAHKNHDKDSSKDSQEDCHQDAHQDAHQHSHQNYQQDAQNNDHQDNYQNAHQDAHLDSHESSQNAHTADHHSAHHDTLQSHQLSAVDQTTDNLEAANHQRHSAVSSIKSSESFVISSGQPTLPADFNRSPQSGVDLHSGAELPGTNDKVTGDSNEEKVKAARFIQNSFRAQQAERSGSIHSAENPVT